MVILWCFEELQLDFYTTRLINKQSFVLILLFFCLASSKHACKQEADERAPQAAAPVRCLSSKSGPKFHSSDFCVVIFVVPHIYLFFAARQNVYIFIIALLVNLFFYFSFALFLFALLLCSSSLFFFIFICPLPLPPLRPPLFCSSVVDLLFFCFFCFFFCFFFFFFFFFFCFFFSPSIRYVVV